MRGASMELTFPVDGNTNCGPHRQFSRRHRSQNLVQRPPPSRVSPPGGGQHARLPRSSEGAGRGGAKGPAETGLALDGQPVLNAVVEGTSAYQYDRGEYIARVPVKAGGHFIRASYPELANLKDPRENLNPDMRRALFVDYLEIAGPFNPSAGPPESYKQIFICGHPKGSHKPECAPRIVQNLDRAGLAASGV